MGCSLTRMFRADPFNSTQMDSEEDVEPSQRWNDLQERDRVKYWVYTLSGMGSPVSISPGAPGHRTDPGQNPFNINLFLSRVSVQRRCVLLCLWIPCFSRIISLSGSPWASGARTDMELWSGVDLRWTLHSAFGALADNSKSKWILCFPLMVPKASGHHFQLSLADGYAVVTSDNYTLRSDRRCNDGGWHYLFTSRSSTGWDYVTLRGPMLIKMSQMSLVWCFPGWSSGSTTSKWLRISHPATDGWDKTEGNSQDASLTSTRGGLEPFTCVLNILALTAIRFL